MRSTGMMGLKVYKLLFIAMAMLISTAGQSKSTEFKLAFLAPEGTSWAINLKEMGQKVSEATENRVKLRYYFGGVAGDEVDVLRKSRIGQLHGGIFTGKTLGDIYSDVRVMELPFTFHKNPDQALEVLNKFSADFTKQFEKKGYKSLGMYEIGHVYVVTTKPVKSLENFKGLKIWIWEGDKIVESMLKQLNLVSVPLALPDVLSSLSSGVIDGAYAPPLGISSLQWHTKIKYLINYPVAYSVGSLLINLKQWNKLSPQDQKTFTSIAKEYIAKANKVTNQDNKETLEELKELGVQFIDLPQKDYELGESLRAKVIDDLQGKVLSEAVLKKLQETISN